MTATELMVLAHSTPFQMRVLYFMYVAAVAVMSEDPGTTEHAARLALAKTILTGRADLPDYTLAVLTQPAEAQQGDATPDSDLAFTVNSLFTPMALVAQ